MVRQVLGQAGDGGEGFTKEDGMTDRNRCITKCK